MCKNLTNYISSTEKILDSAIHNDELAMKCFEENKEKFKNWAFRPLAGIPFDCDDVIEEISRRYIKVLNADIVCECFKRGIKNK